ncbi:MAG TPA: amidohydrolase family protein [Vicinamibacterales bacterium]|nr:amidohydrolase family protein [Vicinamibacterales bacterium]
MTAYRAAWACPIDRPPIRDAIIEIRDGVITGVAEYSAANHSGRELKDLGNVVLLPGLINAHTHLELSWLRGRVPPATSFTNWVKGLLATRGAPGAAMTAAMIAPIHDAIREARASGTVAVGDITNSLAAVEPMHAAGLTGVVFHELLGFKERDGALIEATRAPRAAASAHGISVSLAPHAPYSTSIELFKAIRTAVDAQGGITSVHLGESPEEVELLREGTGPWRGILEMIGAWRDDWPIPGCGPVEYLDRHGLIDRRTLVVHGVQFDESALSTLQRLGATLVTCPRSNQWVGVGYPPIERFYQSGVAVAVGTDSLASVENLNVFCELKTMRWLAPAVPAHRILESATLVGARALGLDRELGSLTTGKSARILAVSIPHGVADVEEYLLSGIEAPQVQWLA